MRSALSMLVLLVGCAGSSAEPEAAAVPEIEMAPTELMVPASQAEMLKEEIAALQVEAEQLREALAEADEPDEEIATQLAVTGANVTALEAELRTMETELSETKARLAASEEENRKLQVALDTTTEAFLTSSTRDVMAIDRIDGRALDPGPRTAAAAQAFAALVATTLDP